MATTATTASELILAINSTIRTKVTPNSITPETHSDLLDNIVGVLSATTSPWSASTGTNSAVLGGSGSVASGITSVSEGTNTITSGDYSHAGGFGAVASGVTSFIHSTNSIVTGDRSAVIGGAGITGATDDTVYMPKVELDDIGGGIIMKSPDGTRYRLTIANGGTLTVSSVI